MLVGKHPLLQHQTGAEAVFAMEELDVGADPRQHQSLLHGTVSTSNNSTRLALKQVAVASSTAGHTLPAQLPLSFDFQPPAVRASCHDNSVNLEEPALVREDLKRPRSRVHRQDRVIPHLGEEAPGLLLHDIDHLAAILPGHAGVVLHIHTLGHQLPTECGSDQQRTEVCPSGVDRGRHASRTATNDHNLFDGGAARAIPVHAARVVREPTLLLLAALHQCILLSSLQLLPQLVERGRLQIRSSLGAALGDAGGTGRAAAPLGVRFLAGALLLLRSGRLAVLLLQQPHHCAEVLAVLLDDLVNALSSGLGRIVFLVEFQQRISSDLDIVALAFLHQALGPLAQRVLVCSRKLVSLLALQVKLECRHGSNALRTSGLRIPVDIDFSEVGTTCILLCNLPKHWGNHVTRPARLAVVVDDHWPAIIFGLGHQIRVLFVGVQLFGRQTWEDQR
mmetsp:Transcript_35709/g.90882  ORF Transcript_35709/g.90882 Transcript_35709/m.90882 type:complete len:449 (-) Transcript_35709:85-1431(-)